MTIDILSSLNTGGSGLNIADLTQTLTAASIDPRRNLINDSIDTADLRLSGYDQLRAQADVLSQSLSALQNLSPLAVSSNSSAVGVTVTDPQALNQQSASISVGQLAQSQVLSFDGFTGPDQLIGAGDLTVDFGSWSGSMFTPSAQPAQTLSFGPTTTLSNLVASLNTLAGVSAQVINMGNGTYSLGVISTTGTENALRFTVGAGADAGLAALDFSATPAAVQVQEALDAELSLNGISVTRSSNEIDDLLPGMTLNLTATTGTAATINATPNTAEGQSALQDFVDAMNGTRSLVEALTARGLNSAQTAGELAGDSLTAGWMRGLEAAMRQSSGALGMHLADLGVETQRDGTLMLDETAFNAAISANPSLLDSLVSNGVSGTDVTVSGTLAAAPSAAASYTLHRDTATGAATLNGVALYGTQQDDGSWTYTVSSGPMRGLSLNVAAGTETATVNYAPSLMTSLQGYLTDSMASGSAMDQRETALNDQISADNLALSDLDRRAEELQARTLAKFTQMETVITQLNSTGDYLTNLIDAWNSNNN